MKELIPLRKNEHHLTENVDDNFMENGTDKALEQLMYSLSWNDITLIENVDDISMENSAGSGVSCLHNTCPSWGINESILKEDMNCVNESCFIQPTEKVTEKLLIQSRPENETVIQIGETRQSIVSKYDHALKSRENEIPEKSVTENPDEIFRQDDSPLSDSSNIRYGNNISDLVLINLEDGTSHFITESISTDDIPVQLQKPNFSSEKYFDSRGGHLILPDPQVYLTISPGAIPPGNTVNISLCANYETPDMKSHPDMSPVSVSVICGPNGYHFQQSVILSYPHCIEDISSCKFNPLISSQGVGERHDYKSVEDVPGASVIIEKQSVTWFLDHFTGSTLEASSPDGTFVKRPYSATIFAGPFVDGKREDDSSILEFRTYVYLSLSGIDKVSLYVEAVQYSQRNQWWGEYKID